MCGRFTRQYSWEELHELMEVLYGDLPEIRQSWNVAPTQPSPVVVLGEQGRQVVRDMTWGLRPAWMQARKPGPINARSETVATNGMFRSAFRSRRCIVPISGFYEWKKTEIGKQPYYIRPLNEPAFCLAGLWENAEGGETFTVLTTRPNELIKTIHDRMPVMLSKDGVAEWLDPNAESPDLFEPAPADEMEAYTVSSRVNSPRNDDASLVQHQKPEQGLFGSIFRND